MIAGVLAGRLLGWVGGAGLPWALGGVAIAAAAGWIWLQASTIDGLRDELVATEASLQTARQANADLAVEIMRQATERARTEAALAAERDAALARAASRGRALQEIDDAPETADRPFDPGVGAALRRLHTGAGADR
ncbi:MAG: hypothetical protein RIB84_23960 [Sneathiellaceae bacterium]